MKYIELGDPLTKSVGEKDVLPIDYSDWLGDAETLASFTATVEPGVSAIVITASQLSEDRRQVLVAYEIVSRADRRGRLLITAHSTNPHRVAAGRAIVIEIS